MARVAGVDIPNEKKVVYSLRYIYGIGTNTASQIVDTAGVNPDNRVRDLSEDELARIRDAIVRSGHLIEGDLRREIGMNIRRLIEIGSYRGSRHKAGLPVRGQRTKTNSRVRKGPRKTVAGRRKAVGKK